MTSIDIEGVMRTRGKRAQWVAAGKVRLGETTGGAVARWYEPLLAPAYVDTITPLQRAQKAMAASRPGGLIWPTRNRA